MGNYHSIRPAAVAGMFYPADAGQLENDIRRYLQNAHQSSEPPKAIIAPHAGYIYSGPVAASAYASLIPLRDSIKRVILLGPAHRVPFTGLAVTTHDAFETPLGLVPVDLQAVADIQTLPQVSQLDLAHAQEHSLEVHIPFLQTVLSDFRLVPIVVGEASRRQVAEVLELLWGGNETLIVISSDLSHYHDYWSAQDMDRETSDAIENLHPELISYEMACGRNPIIGLLDVAARKGLHGEILDIRNSGDTAGDKNRVVGYGAYAFH